MPAIYIVTMRGETPRVAPHLLPTEVATIAKNCIFDRGTVIAPTFAGSLSGNASTASKWATARTLTFTGGITGTGSIDGSGDVSIAMTVPPTGHVHALSTISDSLYKEAADVATTAALTVTATTTTLTNSGTLAALVLDGVTCTAGMRVLVKDQAATAQNGIYTVTNIGSASVAWVLTRTADADTSAEIAGAVVTVDQGTANGAGFFTNDFKKTSTLGTTGMLWRAVIDAGNISSLHHTSGVTAGGAGLFGGGTDGGGINAGANVQLRSWYGIGLATSISGQTVALNTNAFFIDVRSGNWASVGSGNVNDLNIRSDIRLKTNFVAITNAMYKKRQLTGKIYDKKLTLDSDTYVTREAGLIAQDLQKVQPESVHEDLNTGVLSIAPVGTIALLIEALKEVDARVAELEKLIK